MSWISLDTLKHENKKFDRKTSKKPFDKSKIFPPTDDAKNPFDLLLEGGWSIFRRKLYFIFFIFDDRFKKNQRNSKSFGHLTDFQNSDFFVLDIFFCTNFFITFQSANILVKRFFFPWKDILLLGDVFGFFVRRGP